MAAALAAASAGVVRADLKAALNEHDLGKRSKLALENAAAALRTARDAYQQGDNAKLVAATNEIQESVDLAWDSLQSTGKNPRSSPKWFKQAEIETRDLLKKLETLQHDLSFEERPILDKAKAHIQKVHDDLLIGLMEGKHK
jgi:hypothetical protein